MKEPSDIYLLLIGKTGSGKSATGNSILRKKAFECWSSSSSKMTKEVVYEVSEFQGQIIKVVNGPGVGDTRMDNEKAVNLVLKVMEYAIVANPRGYHAFVLVTRFGEKFTAEDQDTIAFLKKIFGETFVRSYCILVLTCGDNFEAESEETGVSFEDWCKEQEGVFAKLMKECDNRIILFDNVTKDERKKCGQIEKLIKMIDNLRFPGFRYTDKYFTKAAAAQLIENKTMKEANPITQKFYELQKQNELKVKIKLLKDLHIQAEHLYLDIFTQDEGTGDLHALCEMVKSMQKTIDEEMSCSQRISKESEVFQKQEEESRRIFEETDEKTKRRF